MLRSSLEKLALVLLLLFTTSFTVFSQQNALNFDGNNDLVDLSNSPSFNIGTTFTFETWVNLDAYPTGENALIFNKWQSGIEDKFLAINPSGNVIFSLFNVFTLNSTYTVQLGQWVHIAATYDGVNARIYINGVENVSTPAAGDVPDGTGTMWLGGNGDGRSILEFDYLDGSLDDTRFWSVARSAVDIILNLDNTLTSGTGLIASYDYNSGVPGGNNTAVLQLTDITPGVLNGSFSGFELTGSSSNFLASDAFASINYALDFDVTDQYIDMGTGLRDNLVGLSTITAEAWVYRTADQAFMTVVGNYVSGGMQFLLRMDGNKVAFFVDSDIAGFTAATGLTDVPLNTWTHIAGSWDGNDIRVYLNGVQDGIASYSGGVLSGDGNNVTIGGNPGAPGGEFMQGQIDEVRIWSTVRTEAQINAFKDVEIDGASPGLAAYYDFAEGPSSILLLDKEDALPDYDGSLTGMDENTDWVVATLAIAPAGPLDTTNPDVTITSLESDPTAANPIEITITFTEEVTGFDLADIITSNAGAGNLNTVDNIVFTADLTPSGSGLITVNISSAAATDLTGNQSNSASEFTITADSEPPVVTATSLSADRTKIFVAFDEPIFGAADGSTLVDAADFAVNTVVAGTATLTYDNTLTVESPSEISLDVTIIGSPDGTEVVEVVPASPTSVYDQFGLTMSVTQTANQIVLGNNANLSFDGVDDYVRVTNDIGFELQQYTIEAWINLPNTVVGNTGLNYSIISKGSLQNELGADRSGFSLFYGDDGANDAFLLGHESGSGTTEFFAVPNSLTPDTWYHVAGTFDGTTMRLYLNGSEIGNFNPANPGVDHAGQNLDLKVGAFEGNGGTIINNFRGKIDEVRIWNYARDAAQIGALLDEEISGNQAGLVAYYDFNSTSGTILTDVTPATRNGTLDAGMDLIGATGNWVSGGEILAPADLTAPAITFGQNLQTIGTTIIGGTHDDNLATIEVSLDGGTTRTQAINNGDGTWNYDMAGDPNYGGNAPYSLNFYITDEAENEGTAVGNVTIDVQNALNFDGVDDVVNVGNVIQGLAALTFEAWVYYTEDGAVYNEIFTKEFVNSWGIDPADKIWFHVGNGSVWLGSGVASTSSVPKNVWTHLAVTWDGSTVNMYINGRLDHTEAHAGPMGTNAVDRGIGNYGNINANPFQGSIDELRAWSVVRTQEQIVADAYTTLTAGTGLLASYDFDEGAGGVDNTGVTGLPDISGNGNNGTLSAPPFTLNGGTSNWVSSTVFDNDVFAPIFLGGTPFTSNFGSDNFDLTAQLNELGLVSYVVLANGAATPTSDEIRAGTGFLGAPAVANGTINITSASTNFVENVTGLAPLTDYDVYVVAEDNEGVPNVSNAIAIDILTLAGPSPGGIGTSLSLWLKADQGVTGTTQVSQWDDQAGGLRHATQASATNQPALTDVAINYNPAISFDGSDDFFTSSLDITPLTTPDLTTIIVFNSNTAATSTLRKLFGHDAGSFQRSVGIDNRSATSVGYFTGSGVADYFNLTANQNYISTTEYTSSTFSGFIDGFQLVNGAAVANSGGNATLSIGAINLAGTEPWDGQIAEMIMYSGTLSVPERNRIDTYLAIKYGISIDQTSATNYVATDDNPVWDGTANAVYNQHIAGIGRDDMSLLNQKQSMSSDGRLAVGLGTIAVSNQANANNFTNDLAYLIWGDNGLDMAFGARNIANVPAGIDSRPQRIWRASEANSDVGNVTLRFDLNGEGYPGTYNPGNFKLLLDTDADFSTGAIELTADSYAGGIVEFNNVNIANGQFFTLGINEPPLPPSDLVVYNSSATEITFEWTDNAFNETGYQILEADNYGFLSGIAIVANIAANSTSFTHTPSADKFYLVVPTNGFEDPTSQSPVEFATIDAFPGQALDFNGTGQYVSVADNDALSFGDGTTDSPMSVEAWIYLDQVTSRSIISKRSGENEWHLVISSDGRVSVTLADQSSSGFLFGESPVIGFNTGEWYHVAFTYNGSSLATGINTYVNGVLQAQNPSTSGSYTAMENTNSTVEIGSLNSGASFNFDGRIDEVRIWDFVKIDYSDRNAPLDLSNANYPAGLVAYYPLDEGAGLSTIDRSRNTNDGSLVSGPTFVPSTASLTPPAAPTGLIAYASSATAITLEWTDNATTETGYNIERDTDPSFGAPTFVLNNGPANTTTFVDGPLSPDQRFYYRVQPINGGEDASSYSSTEFGTNLSFAGDALTFDGASTQIAIPDDPSFDGLSTALTIEAWINTGSSAEQEIVSQFQNSGNFDGYSFGLGYGTPDGRLSFSTTTGGANENLKNVSSPVLSDGMWHHVAVTYDGTTATFYIDGVPYTDAGSSIAAANTNSTMYIGRSNLGSRPFDGQIDEVRIWDGIKVDFTDRFSALNGDELALVAYFPFDEGVGATTVYDASDNTNDGILENGPVFGTSTVPLPAPGEVINTNDDGVGSLRDAITYANANPGTTITFNIPGGGPYQITLASALPDITAANTIIDGTTQPGWAFGDINNMVELDGSGLGTNISGLVINDVANCQIYGLIVTGFTSISESVASIEINGDNADNAVIGAINKGNILHNMVSAGISFQDADFLTIQGNRFGTFDGTTRSEINKHCIYGAGTTDNLVIGGISGAGEGNLISGAGNGRFGIRLNVQGAIFIRGNYIGTNSNGDASIFNEGGGIYLSGANSGEIGGISAGEENVISGNTTGYGIRLGGSVAVINNIIGLDRTGTNPVSNGGDGIIIGGTGGVVVDGNIISSNGGDAITSTTGFGNADIINNIIGFDQSLTISRPNAGGIIIDNGPGTDNRYGFKDNPNIIANNTGTAIYLTNTSTGNTFATNQIYNNGSGIVLEAGANGSIAVPTIDNVTATDASGSGVDGTTIHLYLGDGAGQGQTFLDSTTVSGGIWSIPGLSLLPSDQVVATATDYGVGIGTSAFSAAASMPVELVTNTNDTGAGSLRQAIINANASPGTVVSFNIGSAAPWIINLGSALPQVTAAGTIIDGQSQPGWIFGDPNAMVQVNGSGIGGNANGINIDAADVEVNGLILTGFAGNISNGAIYLASDAADNAIIGGSNKGNIIHGTTGGNAIYIVDGDNATIQGNRIGTLDGSTLSTIGDNGISTTGEVTTLTIGGDFFTGEGNLISGAPANRYGLNLFGSGGSGLSNLTIRGNKIGTNEAASGAIPNTLGGINILGTISAVTIGGPSPSDLNIVSGNGNDGIIIQAGNTFNIDGNYIGLQSDGSSALGNAGSGIRINGAAVNVNIGAISQNFISENTIFGIEFDGNSSSNTSLGTNFISCNQNAGIGYGAGPLTPGATIDDINLTTATISTAAADGSTAYIYLAEDGCSNNQGIALVGASSVTGGQATISGAFAPYAHYVALIEDINGYSVFSPSVLANFVLVTNTNDTGDGSFRAAIDSANTYPGTTILFNLPGSGPWDITLASALPSITASGTIIDATTQPFWDISTANIPNIIGNATINIGINYTSVNNVEVYGIRLSNFNIDGIRYNVVGSAANGYAFGANGRGNIFTGNSNGIDVLTYSGGGTIQGSYFGILPDGTTAGMANATGILVGTNGDNVQIGGLGAGEGNVIANNTSQGIRVASADLAIIQGNIIGLNPTETTAFGSNNGIDLTTATNVTIEQNVISGHTTGIRINNSSANSIIRNNIGVASDGTTPFGNADGISIIDNLDSDNNVIGDVVLTSNGNIIANNTNIGIHIDGAGNNGNLMYRNQIFNNSTAGISFTGGAQNGRTPPAIDPIASATTVTGTGTNGDEIDLYLSDGTGQGASWLGTATVTGGVWSIGSLSLSGGNEVVATATNFVDGTSEFSISATYSFAYPSAEGAGEALSFNGLGNSVTFSSQVAAGRTDFTAEAWINPASFTPGGVSANEIRTILSEGDLSPGNTAFFMGFVGNGVSIDLTASIDAGSGFLTASVPAATIPTNEWTHVAITWSSGSSQLTLYVNGENVANNTSAGSSLVASVDNFEIAGSASTEEDYFDGQIDEVRIWDFAVPENGIRQYLTQKVTNAHPSFGNLVAYYRMDDSGDAVNLLDLNDAVNGSINGATYNNSGAHLGDESIYEYTYTAGSGRRLGNFGVDNLAVANLPLHIYRINQTPSDNIVSGFDNIDRPAYYGVFAPGQTYSVEDSVNGLSPARRILFRPYGTNPTWTPISGPIGTDLEEFRMYAFGLSGSGQFSSSNDQSPYPTPADAGYAMSLDGSGSIDLGANNLPIIGDLTLEAWVNIPSYPSGAYGIVTRSTGGESENENIQYQFRIEPGGELALLYEYGNGTNALELSTGTVPLNQWTHVAVSRHINGGSAEITFYINGVNSGQVINPNIPTGGAVGNPLIGGNNQPGFFFRFLGEMDEVRIWDIDLTEKNIRDHMIGKLDANFDSLNHLVAYYRFDENSGTTATDIAGNINGAITGGTPVISAVPQGEGSIYSYAATPGVLNTAQFGEDINVHYEDATGGIHGYLVAGNPNQVQANGFNNLDQGKYYGVFAPNGQKVTLRMDYNNGGAYDAQRRIVYRTDATDNASVGGWERLSGLLNSDVTNDSIFAYQVPQGEVSTALLNPPSSYPILGDTDPGSALDFDGVDDQVDLGNIASLSQTNAFTIEGWFNQTTLDETRGMFIMRTDASNQIRARTWSDGNLYIYLHNASTFNAAFDYSTVVSANDWFHFAMVFDGSGATDADRMKVYIDGVEVALTYNGTVPTTTPDLSSANFLISENVDLDSDYWLGQMDEFRIWNASVAAADILAFANTTDISTHPNYADMLAYYKFDEGTGSILEDVFANNDGTWNGPSSPNLAPNWVASGSLADAPEQNALNFDGDDYIDFTRQSFPSGLTFEAWINTTSPANTTAYDGNPALTVIGDNDTMIEGAFGIHDGKVRYTHWTGSGIIFDQMDGTVDVNDGQWHHIAVTHKSGSNEVNIYVDGVLDVTTTSTFYSTSVSANRVGSSYLDGTGNDNFFTGDIDEVRIWNVALPESEIRNFLYVDDLTGSTNIGNLVLHYNFNQGAAGGNNTGETAATDQTSNALDGGLNGFILNGATSNFISSGNTSFTPSAPVLQASNVTPSNIMEFTADVSWTNGDGERRVVLVHEGTGNPFPMPADGTFGEAGQYGLGTDLGGGWFVVYNGYGNSTTIENLSGGTDYQVAVLEVNGPPTFDTYNTNTAPDNPLTFTTSTPISNFALDFDGLNDQVQVASPTGFPVGAAPRTLEFWFKSNVDLSTDTDHGIVQYGTNVNGQMFGLITSSNAPGKLYFFGFANDVAGVTDIIQDQWYHAAVTYDGTEVTLYLNGNFEASGSYTLNTVIDAEGLTIGRRPSNEDIWNGQLDEVRIWDYARSQTEIQNHMNNTLIGTEAGLVAYYPFSAGTGSTSAADATGGVNTGTLLNMDENLDWVAGPPLGPPVVPSIFFEDFDNDPLPGIPSSGLFAFGSGVWDGQGVVGSGAVDARGGTGNAARVEPSGGNYIQTPVLDQATSFGFWYKGLSSGGVYEVLASTDGGITWDTSLGTINPDPTYQEFTVDFTSFFDPSYTGAVRIEYISGSNALFVDDVSADVDIVRPNVTITTLPLSDANINQGDNNVMIYKVQADISGGVAALEGLYLTIAGADSLDFQLSGFDFYQNVGSDNFGTATLMGTGSWSPGGPIPRNSIGQLYTDFYPNGTSVFYYVTADISPTANATTFNIGIPDIEQFGFGNSNKIDGGLTAGNNFTIGAGSIPDATFTTIPVTGGNVDVGSVDNLVYQFTIAASGGNITKQGMLVAVGGDATTADFSANGWKLYESVNTDTGIGGATLIGSTNIGDAAPDSVGFAMSGDILDGDTHYYYVAVDINAAATVGNSFNVVLWNGNPTETVGLLDPKNKVDGGFVDGNSFTISGDATAPTVVSLTPSANTIIDSDTQFEIVVQFDENMDTGINPTLNFPVEDPSTTLTFNTGIWDDPLNFRATYDVTDVNINLLNIDVQVTGAQDVAGNVMNIYDGVDAFNIDTENPIITIDTYGTSITSPQLTGTVNDAAALININVDGSGYSATNNADGTWTLAAGLITSLVDGTYDVVATATDPSGNIGTDNTTNELVISQSVVTLPAENIASTSFTARWSEGLDVQTYQIDVSDVADFSTFVSGFQGFQTTATSITVNNLDFSTQYYYRVRLVNTSMEVSSNSNTTQVTTTIDPETVADSLALVQIFNAIAPQGLNWGTARLRNWDGVTLDANRTRVSIVDISNTGSVGNMPNPFTGDALTNGGLSNMTEMNASNNQITGLMEFAGTAIANLNVSGNSLEFDDLEPIVGIATRDYSNQASIQYNESSGSQIEVRHLNDFTLSISIGGSSTNTYTWYRNDVEISTDTDFTLNGAMATILAIDFDNMGTFRTEVTSSLVPGLTIDVDPQAVLAVVDVTMRLTDSDGAILTEETFDGALLEAIQRGQGYDTLKSESNVSAEFIFRNVVLGDYLCGIEPTNVDDFIPTYFGDAFQWDEAEVIVLRSDSILTIKMTADPPELTAADGEGTLGVTIEEDFGDDAGRIDARRRAAKRKCGLRRKRSGGRIEQGDEFVLIAYGETNDNGEFQFGFLPQGTYRFFVEYPGIPIDDSSFVEFEVGEAGVSDTDFKLQAFATSSGIEVVIEAVLGVILEYFKDLEIYPNPSSEYLNVRYRHLKSGDVTAELVDLSGNSMWSSELRDGFDGELRIDVEGYEEGIYILRFYDRERPQENVVSFRVIVKH